MRVNMKIALTVLFLSGLVLSAIGCNRDANDENMPEIPTLPLVSNDGNVTDVNTMASVEGQKIFLKTSTGTLSMTLIDNAATRQLVALCSKGELTVKMQQYGGFEMVGSLPLSLPASDRQITTTVGDVMLYNGNQLVIFLSSNSWSYTRLGKIDGGSVEEVKNFFGGDKAVVVLSLPKK
uniref:Cyclophilin-like domain-containing protein n=1 Tax=Prevotella sp. GTC17260 TaxID=3236796 RepID=A0AB33J6L5_9BACT